MPDHDPDKIFDVDESKLQTVKEEKGKLSTQEKEDRLNSLKILKSINVYDSNRKLNIELTKAERLKFVKLKDLDHPERYTKQFRIGKDKNGLPIRILKK